DGDDERINKAKAILKNAVIGLIIILMSFAIVSLILSKLLDATTGGGGCTPGDIANCGCQGVGTKTCGTDGAWGTCSVGACGPGWDDDLFYIKAISPPDESVNIIRNAKIKFTFNAPPDETTVSAETFKVESGGVAIDGTLNINNKTIEFIPDEICPENLCGAENCFPENAAITVKAINGASGILRAGNGLELNCGLEQLCESTFTTGETIDCEDPKINFYFDEMQVCAVSDNEIGANAEDDSGVALVEFYADEVIIDSVGNPDPINNNPFSASVVWDGSGYAVGNNVKFKATAYDMDDHSASVEALVKLRPEHCCNNLQDADENGIDCGGECISCEGQGPVIYSISPSDNGTPNGAPGNIITIQGKNFGVVESLFENVLTNVDFESGAVGKLPADWSGGGQKHSFVKISSNERRSGNQSILIHQDPNQPYPGTCTENLCKNLPGGCTWLSATRQCSFVSVDFCHLTAPSIYNEGQTLCWASTNRVMWAKLVYNVSSLGWQPGEKYIVQFYYKGHTDASLSISLGYNLGWLGYCAPKSGVYIKPDGSCIYGSDCSEQPGYCCVNAPTQTKCYPYKHFSHINAGTYNSWTRYSAILTYDEAMTVLPRKEIGMSIGYNTTGAQGTNLYIDDFVVAKIPINGNVIFLGDDSADEDDQIAIFPSDLNPNCQSTWQDDKIIVVVPDNAKTGPIKVVAETGLFDKTNNNFGPFINNFEINNIVRPGLCKLELETSQGPEEEGAVIGTGLIYYGINLLESAAAFGDIKKGYVDGLNSSFFNDLQGTAGVPNIQAGKTTTFVLKNNISSNYLDFTKDEEPKIGHSIISFEPTSGKIGQYVTIRGSGFGRLKGTSKVFFGDANGTEASYDFPDICADSVWSDNQVIIKVPEGISDNNYILTMQIEEKITDTNKLAVPKFNVNSLLILKPSLCKINPTIGSNNSEISLWGEYFGDQSTGLVRFNANKDQSGVNIAFWGRRDEAMPRLYEIETTVHQEAITGPVKVVQSGNAGNGINFTVGECAQNSDCGGTDVCCPAGSSEQGRCKTSEDACYINVKSSVYEWDFSTGGSGVGDPCDSDLAQAGCQADNNMCVNELTCDPASCTCQGNIGEPCDSDLAQAGCQDNNSCTGGLLCSSVAGCTCQGNIGEPCDLDPETSVCNVDNSACTGGLTCNSASCTCQSSQCSVDQTPCGTVCCSGACDINEPNKCSDCEIDQNECGDGNCCNGSCEAGYLDYSVCPASCGSYPSGQCLGNFCPNSPGQCSAYEGEVDQIVGACDNAVCDGLGACDASCVYNSNLNKCVSPAVCDLPKTAQDIFGKDIQAYCAEYNGSNRWHINTPANCPLGWNSIGFGKCVEDGTTCDLCASNFTCLNNSGAGVCGIDQNICTTGSSCNASGKCITQDQSSCECCCEIGARDGSDCCSGLVCEGDCGSDLTTDTDTYGYCSGCANVANPDAACNCEGSYGKFCDTSISNGVCRDCAQLSNPEECSKHNSSCCVDNMNNDACRGVGDSVIVNENSLNYCGYYSCDTLDPSICNSTASTTGNYRMNDCNNKCKSEGEYPGTSCHDEGDDACTLDCGLGYECRGESGCSQTTCGYDTTCLCCCNPANDRCGDINPHFICQSNKEPCTATTDERGLCCGCESDLECESIDNVGCGSDACCRARPTVTEVNPGDDLENICRNTIITADFSEKMDVNSFSGNVIVVADYGSTMCPEGTQYLTYNTSLDDGSIVPSPVFSLKTGEGLWSQLWNTIKASQPHNFNFASQNLNSSDYGAVSSSWKAVAINIWNKIKNSFANLFTGKTFAFTIPDPANNYCAIAGTVSGTHNADDKTTLTFSPSQLLDGNRNYYVIIRGDKNLDSKNGVKSIWNIGMKGPNTASFNGITFNNSKIWQFKTLPEQAENNGVCALDHVVIDPSSYLFQTTEAGVKENDSPDTNGNFDSTFDTVKDNDKVFTATARTADGQTIISVAGYKWEWEWGIENYAVVDFALEPNFDAGSTKQLIRAISTVVDDKTFVNVKATITEDEVFFSIPPGVEKTDRAEITVF
ncbi:IPT/TIG domain-containing protein, partial [Patescibacteria group bacterium]|nr:IPT/TIG domain-containing protein [Patescibacteria group bacterium]